MDLRDQLAKTLGSAYTVERELGGGRRLVSRRSRRRGSDGSKCHDDDRPESHAIHAGDSGSSRSIP